MSFKEYVLYSLYDKNMPLEEKLNFISTNKHHWPIVKKCCDIKSYHLTEDKWVNKIILQNSGIDMPETLAIIDKSDQIYPNTLKINSPESLKSFLLDYKNQSLFVKEVRGICALALLVSTI